jgi:hypothetical protein
MFWPCAYRPPRTVPQPAPTMLRPHSNARTHNVRPRQRTDTITENRWQTGEYAARIHLRFAENGLKAEIRQARMIVGAAAERPVIQAVGFTDRHIVDAGMTPCHQSMLVELPILVAV